MSISTSQYIQLFPFSDFWWLYGAFIVLVLTILLIDLGIIHKQAVEPSFKQALTMSGVWVGFSLLFCVFLYYYSLWHFRNDPQIAAWNGFSPEHMAWQSALEFLTGYVVEQALAVDNLFVFIVVFNYFAIPRKYQHRILFYGILGALIFRSIFIALGTILMQYQIVIWIFGCLLIITGVKLLFSGDDPIEPEKNWILRGLRKIMRITPHLHEQRFFIIENGKRYATRLFVALVFLELTDIIFALDSVPAIFALTHEPLIIFTSNICAILGLRSMFLILSKVMDQFIYLKFGLALVLMFVGLKMTWLNELYDGKFPIDISLSLIALFLGGSIGISLLKNRWDKVKKLKPHDPS